MGLGRPLAGQPGISRVPTSTDPLIALPARLCPALVSHCEDGLRPRLSWDFCRQLLVVFSEPPVMVLVLP